MRLCRNDILALGKGPERVIYRLATMSKGILNLCTVSDANVDKRNRDKQDPFKYLTKAPDPLRKLEARRVFVDPIGRVKDPGFGDAG